MRMIGQVNAPRITYDGCLNYNISAPYKLSTQSESVGIFLGLGRAAKARELGARRPELRGNGGCRHDTRSPRFNHAGEEANRRPIPVSS